LSCKGKKAKWFSEIEGKMLKAQVSREIQDQYKTRSYNMQALKIKWTKMSKDRRKKEWIVYGPKHDRQVGKTTKKKKKKVLIEHWTMHTEEGKTSTELSIFKGCENRLEQTKDKCEKWIRQDHNMRVIPELLIEKANSRINATLEQIQEDREIDE